MQVKKQQLELDMELQTGSKSGKEYVKAVYCHPAYLTYMQSTLCEMPGWMKHKLESRLQGEISITSDMQMIPPLWQRGTKSNPIPSKSSAFKLDFQDSTSVEDLGYIKAKGVSFRRSLHHLRHSEPVQQRLRVLEYHPGTQVGCLINILCIP